MTKIHTFVEALEFPRQGKQNLLLGNGFSIALKPDIFTYKSLYEKADFGAFRSAPKLFEAAGTNDFEAVIRLLIYARRVAEIFGQEERVIRLISMYIEKLRNVLVKTLGKNHPDRPYFVSEEEFKSVRNFVGNFDKLYTLNYDLLLYWAMHQGIDDGYPFPLSDGFAEPEGGVDEVYCQWLPGNASGSLYFLHGALHLIDAPEGILKYTFSRTERALMDQMREALNDEKYPLFVAEGDSAAKFEKITHNGYLSRAYQSFADSCWANTRGSIWVFGHSLDANDDHIFRCIKRGRVPQLWVSIKDGDPNADQVKDRAFALAAARDDRKPLNVRFFDADSAQVWTRPDQ